MSYCAWPVIVPRTFQPGPMRLMRLLRVVAASEAQAKLYVRLDVWAKSPLEPLGIIESTHITEFRRFLWDGCEAEDIDSAPAMSRLTERHPLAHVQRAMQEHLWLAHGAEPPWDLTGEEIGGHIGRAIAGTIKRTLDTALPGKKVRTFRPKAPGEYRIRILPPGEGP